MDFEIVIIIIIIIIYKERGADFGMSMDLPNDLCFM